MLINYLCRKDKVNSRIFSVVLASVIVAAGSASVSATSLADADFADLSHDETTTAAEWFELAQTSRQAGDLRQAAAALDVAAADMSPVTIGLERARLAIASGDREKALKLLRKLFDSGFTSVNLVTGDEILNSMAGSQEFDHLVEKMSKRAFPCEHNERFGEFDFWLGDWDVHTADGQYAGHNRIERAERGCVLTEHWVGAAGGTGMSVNYLDLASSEWVQVWNAAGGSQINIRGGLSPEGMALEGTIHYVATGTTAPFRGLWTLLDDGRVRQYFEQSNDEGETWSPWFEGFYTKRTGALDE